VTIFLDSLGDYKVLTLKKCLYKKSDHETINELKNIISDVVAHNMTHLLMKFMYYAIWYGWNVFVYWCDIC
jgi:hypothetical protein